MTTRRQILAITAGALFAPLLAHAQQVQKPWRIGYLSAHLKPTPQEPGVSGGLLKGLRDLGHVEGRDFLIEWKFAECKYDQLDVLAGELVKSNVNVIIANAPNATRAAQTVTSTIPIIFVSGGDPVLGGFVKSLARPGGNITGFYNLSTDLVPKQLELLREAVPNMKRMAVLTNPDNPAHANFLKLLASTATNVGVTLVTLNVNAASQIEASLKSANTQSAQGLIVLGDSFFLTQRRLIARLTLSLKLPMISVNREYAEVGGLMQYGWNNFGDHQRAAGHVVRILKDGLKPADLPVEQSKTLDLVINGKTAKALGITIPVSLALRATEMIE